MEWVVKINHFSYLRCLTKLSFLYSFFSPTATKEDGWQNQKISNFEQSNICCVEQISPY